MICPALQIEREAPIDFSREFIPEHLTPLYHTSGYRNLTADQRLKYNQLSYLYLSEFVVFFERTFDRYMRRLQARNILPARFSGQVGRWLEEEAAHTALFRALNRKIDERYAEEKSQFVTAPGRITELLLHGTFRVPELFPLYPLVMALQEERSMHYCAEYQRHRGRIDPQIAELQLVHSADERHHVALNLELFELLWARASRVTRRLNAALFSWMLREYLLVPKRAGAKVLRALCASFTELRRDLPMLQRELLALDTDPDFHYAQYSRAMLPLTFAALDRHLEFAGLERSLFSYSRGRSG